MRVDGLAKRGIAVAVVSTDKPDDSVSLAARLGLTMALYSDPGRRTIRAWGVADADHEIALPATYVVDATGVVRYRFVGKTNADRPVWAAIEAAINTL